MVDRGSRSRRINQDHGDPLGQAAEFVVAPVLFGLIGWLIDGWLGTAPIFMVSLGVLGFIGAGVANYYRYMAKTAHDEEGKPWTRRQR